MDKLYPPYIEGTIPAFCEDEKGNRILTIPFTMNKTVSTDSVWGFALRMKTIQSNQLVYTTTTQTNLDIIREASFLIEPDNFIKPYKLNEGQFYKVQMAYIKKQLDAPMQQGEIGYFSTVGIVKYTTKPELTIVGMDANELHSDLGTYVGKYYNKDITETLYTYCFNIYDNHNNLVATSGEQLHNHETDTEINETIDSFTLSTALEENKFYKIVYCGITTNGMKVSSPYYRIVQQSSIPPEIDADVIVTMNKDNGYVQIRVQGHLDPVNNLEKNAIGTFQILRSSELGNFVDWQVIKRFALFGSPPSQIDIKDFTVEQGKSYQYALQQYNNDTKLVSDKIYSEIILSDFEDSFLYDGERQLKIKYNPKVTSFKQTLQEAKTVTLGQQYPFILRNGKVNYKEFPISGLISYHMDEEHLFIQDADLGIDNTPSLFKREKTLKSDVRASDKEYFENINDIYGLSLADQLKNAYINRELPDSNENLIARQKKRTTNLVDYNVAAERIFKLKVLEFLNDGQPKLFRSPGEGNYIVRLMNSSLAPNDQLGRMLHTFSTTATEVNEFSSQVLEDIGIINTKEIDTRQQRWETILLSDMIDASADEFGWIKINRYTANSLQCLDMVPDTQIRLTFADAPKDPLIINIGVTGAYFTNLERDIEKIEINNKIFKTSLQGQITYSFYGTTFNHFDTYKKIKINDIPLMQMIGEQRNDKGELVDVKTKLTDVRNIVTNFNLLHFIKRDIIPIYKYANNTFYSAPLYVNSELVDEVHANQIPINLKDYTADYEGKESIFWAPTAPNKQNYWETIYSYNDNDKDKGVINIRASIANNAVGLEICYQTNQQLIAFKEKIKTLGYKYKKSVRIIANDESDFKIQLNLFLDQCEQNDVIIVNGVTSYVCTLKKDTKEWTQLSEKLGTIVSIDPSSNSWFRIESGDEYITEIKIRIPKLKARERRDGYLVYETYFNITTPVEGMEEIKEFDPLCVYKIVNNANFEDYGFSEELYLDGRTQEYIKYSNAIKLDDSYVDITSTEEYQVTIPNEIDKVYIPSGVLADIGIQRRTIEYGIESKGEYYDLIKYKEDWLKELQNLEEVMFSEKVSSSVEEYKTKLETARTDETKAYKLYIEELKKQLNILAGEEANL